MRSVPETRPYNFPEAPANDVVMRPDTAEDIPMLRGHIDAIDEVLIRLIAERTKLSSRIQEARIRAGGTRVELGRERVIRDTFRDGLGPDGPELAGSILQVCRGRR